MRDKWGLRWLLPCLSILLLGVSSRKEVRADHTGAWSEPVVIFEGEPGSIQSPVLASDGAGAVHALWTTEDQGESDDVLAQAIYYSHLEDGRWSQPVDIVSALETRFPTAAVDLRGTMHILWQGDNLQYFTAWAYLGVATSARGWSTPIPLGMGNLSGQIVADRHGVLHVAFPGLGNEGPVYRSSSDGGKEWSIPKNVASPATAELSVDWVRLGINDRGSIHVVWTEFELPNGWPPTGVYYARSSDGGETWSTPTKIAGEGFDQISVAVVGEEIVHVAWNGMAGVYGRYHRSSSDSGESWSDTLAITTGGATSGLPQMALDSAGVLHLLTSVDECAQYANWSPETKKWTELECISGPEARASEWIEEPALAISGGNNLHALFWDSRERLWYSSLHTGAPSVDPVEFNRGETAAEPDLERVPSIPGESRSVSADRSNDEARISDSTRATGPGLSLAAGALTGALSTAVIVTAVAALKRTR